MDYAISSLHVGTFVIGEREDPVHAWLVRGADRTILVDAGTPEPETVARRWRTGCPHGGQQALLGALREHGVMPEEVDTLVLTHLHFDHAWNFELFERAQVVVQRLEVIHAIDPTPTHRGYYSQELNARLVRRKKPHGLRIVQGDLELAEGIALMLLPGHTPGTMGVVVQTSRGAVGLGSDAGETYANWFPADGRASAEPVRFLADSFLPPHIWTESAGTCIESMRRLSAACSIVVPSHDWRIPREMPEQWWALPPA